MWIAEGRFRIPKPQSLSMPGYLKPSEAFLQIWILKHNPTFGQLPWNWSCLSISLWKEFIAHRLPAYPAGVRATAVTGSKSWEASILLIHRHQGTKWPSSHCSWFPRVRNAIRADGILIIHASHVSQLRDQENQPTLAYVSSRQWRLQW